MRKTLSNENGITLIALVITIIVMLILVTVTIRIAQNGNLFKHAANAASRTKTAAEGENELSSGNIGRKSIEQIVAENTGEVYVQEIHNWQRSGDTLTCTCDACKELNPSGRTYTIGEAVDYQDNGTGTSSITAAKSGLAQRAIDENDNSIAVTQTISKDSTTTWVVLGREDKNKNGTFESLLLTTEYPTANKITLYGVAGYNYWVDEGNRIARELYGTNARGMTIEDVYTVLGYTPPITPHLLSTDENFNSLKQNGTKTPDPNDTDSETDLGNYTVNGYYHEVNSTSGTTAAKTLILNGATGKGNGYWLASRGVGANSFYAYFGPGLVRDGGADSCSDLFHSNGFASGDEFAFRAVVSLESNLPDAAGE